MRQVKGTVNRLIAFMCMVILCKTAVASPVPRGCLSAFSSQPQRAIVGFLPEETGEIENLVREMQAELHELQLPPVPIQKVHAGSILNSAYAPEAVYRDGVKIFDEQINAFIGAAPKALKASLTVLSHEIGHTILEYNYIVNFNGRRMVLHDVLKKLNSERESLRARHNLGTREEAESLRVLMQAREAGTGGLSKYLQAYDQFLKPIDDQIAEFIKFRSGLRPYNELFGDLVAVVTDENLSAMADAMLIPRIAPYISKADTTGRNTTEFFVGREGARRPRDFSQDIPAEGWKPDSGDNYDYTLFDPARSWIAQKYLGHFKKMKKEKLLIAFLKATEKHLEARIRRGEDVSVPTMVPTELNQEFIALLGRAMGN